jgi:hypothetical protein
MPSKSRAPAVWLSYDSAVNFAGLDRTGEVGAPAATHMNPKSGVTLLEQSHRLGQQAWLQDINEP